MTRGVVGVRIEASVSTDGLWVKITSAIGVRSWRESGGGRERDAIVIVVDGVKSGF